MRRDSGPQQGSSYYLRKEAIRAKSPQAPKSKGKGQNSSSSHLLPTRKTTSFIKPEPNQSSTVCTISKGKKSTSKQSKKKELKKYQKQIMTVLNQSAALIQREWRKYLVRKYRSIRDSMEKEKNQRESRSSAKIVNVSRLNPFKEEHSVSDQTSQAYNYNRDKYLSSEDLLDNRNKKAISSKNIFEFQLQQKKLVSVEEQEPQSFNLIPLELFQKNRVSSGHLRTTSDKVQEVGRMRRFQKRDQLAKAKVRSPKKQVVKQETEIPKEVSRKSFQFSSNIIEIKIHHSTPERNDKNIKSEESSNSIVKSKRPNSPLQKGSPKRFEDHYIKNEQTIEDLLLKLEKGLEQKKLKKMLALESSFSNNLMTFRSYQKNVQQVTSEHWKKIKILQTKKAKIVRNWKEIVDIYDQESDLSQIQSAISNLQQEQPQEVPINVIDIDDEDISLSQVATDINSRSIVFEEWDFEAGLFSGRKRQNLESANSQKKNHSSVSPKKMEQIQEEDAHIDRIKGDISHKQIVKEESTTKQQSSQKISSQKAYQKCQEPVSLDESLLEIPKSQQEIKSSAQAQQKQKQPQQSKIAPKDGEENRNQQPKTNENYPTAQIQSQKDQQKCEEINRKQKPTIIIQEQEEYGHFHPIRPDIDLVNTWLLQISHFVLDNYGKEFLIRLISVQQPSKAELWLHAVREIPFTKQYQTIPYKIFKQFEFFNIKAMLKENYIEDTKKDSYSALLFAFHQSLYDCLNKMLMDELIYGRQWIRFPWSSSFHIKKNIGADHSKQCLEKAINRVSNVSDYSMFNMAATRTREFEEAQNNMIFSQEIKEISFECEFTKGRVLYQLATSVIQQIFFEESATLMAYMMNFSSP